MPKEVRRRSEVAYPTPPDSYENAHPLTSSRSVGAAPQRHSSSRCHQPRVLPLLLLQLPRGYQTRRGKIAFENPIRISYTLQHKDVHPHMLRHTFATELYRQTKDIRLVQKALGHSDLSTTMIYTHIVDEDLEGALKRFHLG